MGDHYFVFDLLHSIVIKMFMKKKNGRNGHIEFDGIVFEVIRRDVKYFRVEFSGQILRLILPRFGNPNKIIKENISRIKKKYSDYLKIIEKADSFKFSDRDINAFNVIVKKYIKLYEEQLKVTVKIVKYRKMRRMWGNCRSNGVITLNKRLIKLPENIVSYIIYHELLHLNEKGGHSPRFRKKIKSKFPDHKRIESDLRSWFIKFEENIIKYGSGL